MRRFAQVSALERRIAAAQPNCKSLHWVVPSAVIVTFLASAISGAWKHVSKRSGNEYLSPSILAPELGHRTLYANLGKMPGQDNLNVFSIIWNTDDDRG